MRFQVSKVMDAIEQRLTTDLTGAQAIVDLGEIVNKVELDGGRPVNLVRIGMVLDALSRYLVDNGAMLYGVVERSLLAEAALTSKERMVLGRWADDGRIEVTPTIGDRVVEIADLTGLPLIALRPFPEHARLGDDSGRVLLLTHRNGVASLRPMNGVDDVDMAVTPAVGRAKVPVTEEPDKATENTEATENGENGEATENGDDESKDESKDEGGETGEGLPLPLAVFGDRGVGRVVKTRISWRRFRRVEPDGPHAAVLRREWRCDSFECPAFGESRQIGQPVPRMRDKIPVCPRHDQPVVDVGPRPPAYALSIVIDDLPRRRVVVRGGRPVEVGRAAEESSGNDFASRPGEPELVSVAPWLHEAAAARISLVHLRLEASDDGLAVVDVSDCGTVVWQRTGPNDPGTARLLHRERYTLGDWDGVELYTGIELVRSDRRLTAVLGRDEPASVLLDAPTAAHHHVENS